jgi:hypothetical protein
MTLKSNCCNYEILRTVLEMIDLMSCHIEDNIKALSWQSFSALNFLFPFQKRLTVRMLIPEDNLETS